MMGDTLPDSNALVLLSGGQDSTTCLYWAKKHFDLVEAIRFDYGQRHKVELECSEKIAGDAGVKLTTLSVEALKQLGGFALTDLNVDVKSELNDRGLPNTFVPGRNLLFLTLAAAYAYPRNIQSLVTGVCQTDYSGYPDCRKTTIDAVEESIKLGMDFKGFDILTPLMHLTKAETVLKAVDLNCLDIIVNDTHTCYNGDHSTKHYWGYGCGTCGACELRKKGFDEAFLDNDEKVASACKESMEGRAKKNGG